MKQSRIVFTTCIGAACELLRHKIFENVLILDASNQDEPTSLVPLIKGCCRTILFGDHTRHRPVVQKHAAIMALDISLFERLQVMAPQPRIAKVMLDTQYLMHPSICEFSCTEFYGGLLKSARRCGNIALPSSAFPWPESHRVVLVQSSTPEDLAGHSKSNKGQNDLCHKICDLLLSPSPSHTSDERQSRKIEVAIVAPYASQRTSLNMRHPTVQVLGFEELQDQQADVVILVTVRCNASAEMGVLEDLRRLNAIMTTAKAGVIIIGDEATLTSTNVYEGNEQSKAAWRRLLKSCARVVVSS